MVRGWVLSCLLSVVCCLLSVVSCLSVVSGEIVNGEW